MILADKITEERKKNGWSQEELAEKLGVSRQSVSKWESAGSVPDLQKVIQLAELFGVSTDYLLKDALGQESRGMGTGNDPESTLHQVSMEEANAFLNIKKEAAPIIANATALCILSPILLILLLAFSENRLLPITWGMALGIGCTVLFIFVAIAVFLFITCGIRMSRLEQLEREPFETEYGVTGMVREKSRGFEEHFSRGIALGVVLCIVSVIPLLIAGTMNAPEGGICVMVCVAVLLALVALGVDLIIRVVIVKGSYDALLQEGEYSQKEKRAKKKLDTFSGVYWCLATAIYLGWSFWTMRWDFTWLVWPVAGVLFAAVSGIARMFLKVDGE